MQDCLNGKDWGGRNEGVGPEALPRSWQSSPEMAGVKDTNTLPEEGLCKEKDGTHRNPEALYTEPPGVS